MTTSSESRTDDEIRIAIAEARGFTWYTDPRHTARALAKPGSLLGRNHAARGDEPLDDRALDFVPDWPASLDAAWSLVEEMQAWAVNRQPQLVGPLHFQLHAPEDTPGTPPGEWTAYIGEHVSYEGFAELIHGSGKTPARAICELYLAWKQQH